MIYLEGDIIKYAKLGYFDVLCHGCNCFNTMNSGVAKAIRTHYHGAWTIDQETHRGSRNKLGTYTVAEYNPKIVNCYTQYDYGYDGKDRFEYDSFKVILGKLAAEYPNKRFGFPKIGSGLAGGDWNKIEMFLLDFDSVISTNGGSVTIVTL